MDDLLQLDFKSGPTNAAVPEWQGPIMGDSNNAWSDFEFLNPDNDPEWNNAVFGLNPTSPNDYIDPNLGASTGPIANAQVQIPPQQTEQPPRDLYTKIEIKKEERETEGMGELQRILKRTAESFLKKEPQSTVRHCQNQDIGSSQLTRWQNVSPTVEDPAPSAPIASTSATEQRPDYSMLLFPDAPSVPAISDEELQFIV
jgi:hypothetical protein